MRKVEFFKHNIGPEEIASVSEALKASMLTTGERVQEFEERFAACLGCRYAVGLTSCTGALHVSLLAYGVGPGDEVITTPMSFVATSNAILQAGASPVFVDVERETGNINADLVEQAISSRTKAILPVHLYGQMCDMKRIRKIADRHGLVVIEDAAHALEAERDGIRPGQLGEAACFSFYPTKSITSGEGGAAVANAPEIATKLKKLRLHGMDLTAMDRYGRRYQHWDADCFGWKYNMDNIQAALLLPQLRHVEEYWRRREQISRRYEEAFSGTPGLDFPKVLPGSKSGRNLFTIWVGPERRDEILWQLQEQGVGVVVNYWPIHLLSYYRRTFEYGEGMFPIAEEMGQRTIALPLYPKLTDEEVDYVIAAVRKAVGKPSGSPKGKAGPGVRGSGRSRR
jgi:dTDP-4-amino-4,6-dideoxygalactose transaminase